MERNFDRKKGLEDVASKIMKEDFEEFNKQEKEPFISKNDKELSDVFLSIMKEKKSEVEK